MSDPKTTPGISWRRVERRLLKGSMIAFYSSILCFIFGMIGMAAFGPIWQFLLPSAAFIAVWAIMFGGAVLIMELSQ